VLAHAQSAREGKRGRDDALLGRWISLETLGAVGYPADAVDLRVALDMAVPLAIAARSREPVLLGSRDESMFAGYAPRPDHRRRETGQQVLWRKHCRRLAETHRRWVPACASRPYNPTPRDAGGAERTRHLPATTARAAARRRGRGQVCLLRSLRRRCPSRCASSVAIAAPCPGAGSPNVAWCTACSARHRRGPLPASCRRPWDAGSGTHCVHAFAAGRLSKDLTRRLQSRLPFR
jgi:hypothetical protein